MVLPAPGHAGAAGGARRARGGANCKGVCFPSLFPPSLLDVAGVLGNLTRAAHCPRNSLPAGRHCPLGRPARCCAVACAPHAPGALLACCIWGQLNPWQSSPCVSSRSLPGGVPVGCPEPWRPPGRGKRRTAADAVCRSCPGSRRVGMSSCPPQLNHIPCLEDMQSRILPDARKWARPRPRLRWRSRVVGVAA